MSQVPAAFLAFVAVLALPALAQSAKDQPTPPSRLRIILEANSPVSSGTRGESVAHKANWLPITQQELKQTTSVITRRVTGYGLPEPAIQTDTTRGMRSARLTIDIPGARHDQQTVKALKALLTTRGELQFLAVPRAYAYRDKGPEVRRVAVGETFAFTDSEGKEVQTPTVLRKSRILGTSRDLRPNAHVVSNPGQPVGVAFELMESARPAFQKFTGEHVGSYIAIVLDGRILACPIVKTSIPGSGVIESGFNGPGSTERARQLAVMINSGPLPLSVSLVKSENLPVSK